MKDLYPIAGVSKQALWKHKRREEYVFSRSNEVVKLIKDVRTKHKRLGCRTIYQMTITAAPVGRDAFEHIGFANGFRLKRLRNKLKTTWSQRIEVYPNLIEGKSLNGTNQVWQSDIFYIDIENVTHYGFTVLDVYSRKILGLHISKSLAATQLVIALKAAIRSRSGQDTTGCIIHSDRGSQYISEGYKTLVRRNGMFLSMAKFPQENAYVERVQGTLKNDYLYPVDLCLRGLHYQVAKSKTLYNDERPHRSLGMMTPSGFERHVNNLEPKARPVVSIYKWDQELFTKSLFVNKKEKVAKKKKSTKSIN